jgi:ribosomal protein L11 methyltransferase
MAEAKNWTQITATLAEIPEDWSAWDTLFDAHGVPGTVVTDRPPTISGYMFEPDPAALAELVEVLRSMGADASVSEVPEEDWAESWKQFFIPRRVGQRVVIRPTWEEYPAGPDDIEIVLDPGQSFGTGDHPTTRMCLELLETTDLAGKDVADVGCGSGILAVLAEKLGCASLRASDIDPICVTSSLENAARNDVTFLVHAGKGFEGYPDGETYDVVVSNIISAALIVLAPDAADRVRAGGEWIVSGVIESNWPDVKAAAERVGFELVERKQELEWNAARFRKKA